jgi:hypothetical protein
VNTTARTHRAGSRGGGEPRADRRSAGSAPRQQAQLGDVGSDDYDVIWRGRDIGRIFKPKAGVPEEHPWRERPAARPSSGRRRRGRPYRATPSGRVSGPPHITRLQAANETQGSLAVDPSGARACSCRCVAPGVRRSPSRHHASYILRGRPPRAPGRDVRSVSWPHNVGRADRSCEGSLPRCMGSCDMF